MSDTPSILTEQDYENGFTEVEVLYRSGKRETIRITAPSYREAQTLQVLFATTKNPFSITRAALPEEKRDEKFLDRLTPHSAEKVEVAAFALTFGEEVLKKMTAEAEKFLEATMGMPGAGPKPPSSEPVILSNT